VKILWVFLAECLYVNQILIRSSLQVLTSQEPHISSSFNMYSRTPLIRKLVIRIANYPYRLGPSGTQFLTVMVLHLFVT
jgi:hypothetical protein